MSEPGARPKALVVDDESQMVSIVAFALETEGFEATSARNAEDAWRRFAVGDIDLAVLDVMLPGASGLRLARRIRADGDVPIIMLSARGEEEDRLAGLAAGADDYVTKPFSPRELAMRAAALVRRAGRQQARLRNGPLVLDPARRAASWDARPLQIPDLEFRLLCVLTRNAGAVVGWRELLNQVWHTYETGGGRDMIKAAVHRLRARLPAPARERLRAVRGVGYQMDALDDDS